MPQYQDPAVADALRYLRGRIEKLDDDVKMLRASRGKATIDRGDHEAHPNPYEGQTMINYASDQPYYYSRGQWRPFGGSDIPWARRSSGFDASNQSIGNNSFTNLTFNHDYNMGTGESGEPYFSADGTNGISITQDGFYLLTAMVNWYDSLVDGLGWLMGFNMLSPSADFPSLDAKGADNGTTMTGFLTEAMRIDAGRVVRLEVWQSTGSSKNVDVCFLEIARIGTYTGTSHEDMNPAV